MKASDPGVSLLEFVLIQYVLAVFIPVMTVRAGEIPRHVDFMREGDQGPLFLPVGIHVVEHDFVGLCTERG
jgi:hypothetical protein